MGNEAERDQEIAMERFKQSVFASAFGSFDPSRAIKQYYEIFEEKRSDPEYDFEIDEFEPESEEDVVKMLNEARRAGAIR